MPYLDEDQNTADESVIAEQLKRRKLYDLGIEPMAETQPPDVTTKESLYQPGPAMEAYKTEIGNEPKHADYHPSKTRSTLGNILGVISGIVGGPERGYEASSLVKDAPYRQKLYEYNQNLGPIEQKAKIEAGENTSGQKYYTDLAKIRHENAQREAEVSRKGAEESHGKLWDYQQTPSYWEQRQKIAQIQHGGDKSEGVIVTDKTGSKHMGRILPSGAFEDAQGHIIADDQIDKVAKVGAPGSAALQLERVMENGKPVWRSREDAIGQEAPGSEGKESDFERFYTDFKLKKPDATRVEAHQAYVSRPQKPPQALQLNPKTHRYELVGPGSPEIEGGQAPAQVSQMNTPTTFGRNRGEAAQSAILAGNDIQKFAAEHRQNLGNLDNYWKSWTSGTPIADPVVSEFLGRVDSWAAMQGAAHGLRSGKIMEDFEKRLGSGPKNVDSVISAINGINAGLEHIVSVGKGTQSSSPSAPKATKRYNPATGKIEEIK